MVTSLDSALFSTHEMDAVFGDRARVQRMLDVEAALGRALVAAGVAPAAIATPIADACAVDRFDLEDLGRRARDAGNLAIPMVEALTRVTAAKSAEAAGWVHRGATSQDVIDTGLLLQVRDAAPLLAADLERLERSLAALARNHRDTLMAGRTWLQHATPVTFGLKAAGALDALRRTRRRLAQTMEDARVLQFGGAAGTLASLDDHGLAVADALARELNLAVPPIPWHAHRERIADVGCALALLCGGLGKLARDLSLLMQTDVGEALEPLAPGRGGSSTMPHKRNPVACAVALQAAQRAPGLAATLLTALPQEHERGLGGWQAEWATLPELFRLAAGSAAAMAQAWDGVVLDPVRMRANLEVTRGLIMAEALSTALAAYIGRDKAHARLQDASRRAASERKSLGDVARADPRIVPPLTSEEVEAALDPARHVGSSSAFIDAVLKDAADD